MRLKVFMYFVVFIHLKPTCLRTRERKSNRTQVLFSNRKNIFLLKEVAFVSRLSSTVSTVARSRFPE